MTIQREGEKQMGNFPCIIGEIGIPYDMDSKSSYTSGNYSQQVKAMDANFHALETNMLNFTIWNYCPDNCHQHGDQWNGEDLSIFSRVKKRMSIFIEPMISGLSVVSLFDHEAKRDSGQSTTPITSRQVSKKRMQKIPSDLNIGGRALEAIVRPFPIALAGVANVFSFEMKTKIMMISFRHPQNLLFKKSDFYLPHLQYPVFKDVMFIHDDKNGVFQFDYQIQRVSWMCGCKDSNGLEECLHTLIIKNTSDGEVGGVHYWDKNKIRKMSGRSCYKSLCSLL